jgi:hypothetical protein
MQIIHMLMLLDFLTNMMYRLALNSLTMHLITCKSRFKIILSLYIMKRSLRLCTLFGSCCNSWKDQPPYKYEGWRPIHNTQSNLSIHIYYFLIMFSNLIFLLVLRCRRYSSLQWWQSPKAVRPSRAAHSRRTPWRGPSWLCRVSGLKRPHRCVLCIALLARLLRGRILRIALIARGTRWRVRVRTVSYKYLRC